MARKGYSRKGFFGQTVHYDASGKMVGKSRPGLFGRTEHFDADGKRTGYSRENLFGGHNHYDTNGRKKVTAGRVFSVQRYILTVTIKEKRTAVKTFSALILTTMIERRSVNLHLNSCFLYTCF